MAHANGGGAMGRSTVSNEQLVAVLEEQIQL